MNLPVKIAVLAFLMAYGVPAEAKKKQLPQEPIAGKSKKPAKPAAKKKVAKKEDDSSWDCALARAARLSVNSAHQSCVRTKGIKKFRVRDSVCKPVSEKRPKGLKCDNRQPAAAYGGGKRMEVINRLIDPTPHGKTDCSGFASGVFCRAGARLRPYKNCELTHTAELMALGNSKDCFETFKFSDKSHLRPGCMVIWRKGAYGHVVLVEKVGKDPFGLKAGCQADPMTFNKWNFEVAESATSGGPTVYDARRRFSPRGGTDREAIFLLRKRLCESVEKKESLFAAAFDDDLTAKILCHAGAGRPGCIDRKNRSFKQEACIAHCTP